MNILFGQLWYIFTDLSGIAKVLEIWLGRWKTINCWLNTSFFRSMKYEKQSLLCKKPGSLYIGDHRKDSSSKKTDWNHNQLHTPDCHSHSRSSSPYHMLD